MALQSVINTEFSVGVAGDPVNPTEVVYTAINPVAETDITVGNFVFKGTDPLAQIKAGGSAVAGFAVRVQTYPNYTITSSGSLVAPAGEGISVAVKGYFYAVASTTATAGQAVFANTTTGAIKTGTAGGTVSDHIETNFKVLKGGSEGDIIIIGNWE